MASIQAVQASGVKGAFCTAFFGSMIIVVPDLRCVSNNCGVDNWGLGILLQTKQVLRLGREFQWEFHLLLRSNAWSPHMWARIKNSCAST